MICRLHSAGIRRENADLGDFPDRAQPVCRRMRRRHVQRRGDEEIRMEVRVAHRAVFRVVSGADAAHRMGGGVVVCRIHHGSGPLDSVRAARIPRRENVH